MNKFIIFLIISVIGIFLLMIISLNLQPQKISSYSELKENSYVKVRGKITEIKNYQDFSAIKLDNNITITCNCKFPVNQTISAIGRVEEYKDNLQVNAEKIELISNFRII